MGRPTNPTMPKWSADFKEWKRRASKYASNALSLSGLFGRLDVYDLGESSREAFDRGVHPHAFIQQAFAEDFASLALDDDQRRQADQEYASEFAAEIDALDADTDQDEEHEAEEPEDFHGEVVGQIIDGVIVPERQSLGAV